jgi:hypothetical protein
VPKLIKASARLAPALIVRSRSSSRLALLDGDGAVFLDTDGKSAGVDVEWKRDVLRDVRE